MKSSGSKLSTWLASPNGKTIMGYTYGFGAAIVILGALFKLMHWPGASAMLIAGMGTEFFVFIISAFEKPHDELEWNRVFPVLSTGEDKDNPLKNLSIGGGSGGGSGALQGAGFAFPEGLAKKFEESIVHLNNTANELAKISNLSSATQEYVNTVSALSLHVGKIGTSSESIASISNDITGQFTHVATNAGAIASHVSEIKTNSNAIKEQSAAYSTRMSELNNNVAQLTSVYEAQVKGMVAQVDAIKAIHDQIKTMHNSISASSDDATRVKKEMVSMADQLVTLNEIYSRMIKSMTNNFNA